MDLGIAGKKAAVAAATAGLGFASAAALAAEGVHVAICGHTEAGLAAALARLGENAVGMMADLSQPDECQRFVEQATEQLGGLDILVTNGPGPKPGTFATSDPVSYQTAVELNLLSVVRMCYAAVPVMQQQKWGRIVAITSLAVRQPIANLILSNTARAGTTGFLKTLAREIALDGITVNSLQPGLHETNRVTAVYQNNLEAAVTDIPAGELGRPADFGALVAVLCSDQARYLTGAAIPVDGGLYQALL